MSVQWFGEWELHTWTLDDDTLVRPWIVFRGHAMSIDDDANIDFAGSRHAPLDAIKALIAAHEAWLAKQEGKV